LLKILSPRRHSSARIFSKAILAPLLPLRIENYECCVTVFNSSVENRVEKPHATFENVRQDGAYCSLHKFGASESWRRIFRTEKAKRFSEMELRCWKFLI
jgi:hypothetical protein